MFNNYRGGDVTNTLKINACSGGIYKTYKESWFNRFHLNSPLSDELFRKEKCFYNVRSNKYGTNKWDLKDKYDNNDEKNIYEVVILQMVICGDMEVIAEIMLKQDFEKYNEPLFKEGEKQNE